LGEELVVLLFGMMILAGVAVLWMAMQSRRRIREMEHRERLAMIERGLIPPPELDPALFERRTGIAPGTETPAAARSRSIGVMMIGLGFGTMFLITFAGGAPGTGVGIGGAFAILGAAFYVNSKLASRYDGPPVPPPVPRVSSSDRPDPPSHSVP
jgi:hypothetical protein